MSLVHGHSEGNNYCLKYTWFMYYYYYGLISIVVIKFTPEIIRA